MQLPVKLKGIKKAAILLIALGSELSSQVLKREFSETEIEQLTMEISKLNHVPAETTIAVLDEFMELQQAREYLLHGGISYARELLEKAVGSQRALEILDKLTSNVESIPFGMLRDTDPKQLLNFIRDEHPQTIALILAHLSSQQAAAILEDLPPGLQSEISRRIAGIDRLAPDIVKRVESVLENKLLSVGQEGRMAVGGVQSLVNILNKVGRGAEKVILEGLEEGDPVLAEKVKMRLFIFEDIRILSDNDIQRVLREVETRDLALAMRGANEEVHGRIYKNMSRRAADMLREEIEIMGPVRLRDVEQAQQKTVAVIRRLDEAGEIIISRGGDDDVII